MTIVAGIKLYKNNYHFITIFKLYWTELIAIYHRVALAIIYIKRFIADIFSYNSFTITITCIQLKPFLIIIKLHTSLTIEKTATKRFEGNTTQNFHHFEKSIKKTYFEADNQRKRHSHDDQDPRQDSQYPAANLRFLFHLFFFDKSRVHYNLKTSQLRTSPASDLIIFPANTAVVWIACKSNVDWRFYVFRSAAYFGQRWRTVGVRATNGPFENFVDIFWTVV